MNINLLLEDFTYTNEKPGFIGYYEDEKGNRVWVSKTQAEKLKYEEDMTKFLQNKSKASLFALKHGIMFTHKMIDAENERGFTDWIGHDSWYEEDNFFFVTEFPGYSGETIAFQLRVSDHTVNPNKEFKSHINRLENPQDISTIQYAQFILNLIIDEVPRKIPNEIYRKREGLTVLNCKYNEEKSTPDELAKIDEFLRKLVNGSQPTISYPELIKLFGNDGSYIESYGLEYSDKNFIQRKNIRPRALRMKFLKRPGIRVFSESSKLPFTVLDKIEKYFENKATEEEIIDLKGYFPKINNNPIEITTTSTKTNQNGETVTVENKRIFYQLDDYNKFGYLFEPKTSNLYMLKVKQGNGLYDERSVGEKVEPIEVMLETIVRITMNDIKQMVAECIKEIKKRVI